MCAGRKLEGSSYLSSASMVSYIISQRCLLFTFLMACSQNSTVSYGSKRNGQSTCKCLKLKWGNLGFIFFIFACMSGKPNCTFLQQILCCITQLLQQLCMKRGSQRQHHFCDSSREKRKEEGAFLMDTSVGVFSLRRQHSYSQDYFSSEAREILIISLLCSLIIRSTDGKIKTNSD